MIRVPIGPRRKENCEVCGNKIETKEFVQHSWNREIKYAYSYPQIIHLEHANTLEGDSRPEIVKELCQECMQEFGAAVEKFFADWVEPEPVPTYNDYLKWLQQQRGF